MKGMFGSLQWSYKMSNEAQLIQQLVRGEIDDNNRTMYTSFPATILEYDGQFCKVQPVMDIRYQDGDKVTLPAIKGVPVIFPSGGGGILTFPIKKGDSVWVSCSMVAMDEWLTQYSLNVSPSTMRSHALNDAVAFPTIPTRDTLLNADPDHIEIKLHKDREGESVTYSEEVWNSVKLKNDGSVDITTDVGHSVLLNQDGSSVIENSQAGYKVECLADGNIEVTTAATIKIQNSSEELITIISDLMGLLSDKALTTTNTLAGPMPLNSAAAIAAIKARVDTLKG